MKSLTRIFALMLWTACILLGARAESAPTQPETVIVPYDASKPLAGQRPDQLYVPYERFMELWDAAKKNRRGPEPENANVSVLLNSARYEGTLMDNNTAQFRGVIDLNTYSPWVTVPLPMEFDSATVQSLTVDSFKLDGVPAAFDNYQLLVEKPGRHTAVIEFRVMLSPRAASANFFVPRTPATRVSLALPRPQMHALIEGGGMVEKIVNGQRIVTATLGDSNAVRIKLDSSTVLSRLDRPAVVRVGMQLLAGRAVDSLNTQFDFSFPAAQQDRFVVFFDKDATLVDLSAANLKSWKLIREAEVQVLEVQLNEPVKEQFGFTITCERNAGALTGTSKCPFFSAAAGRVEHEASLFSGEGLNLTPRPTSGFRQVAGKGDKVDGFRFSGTFAWSGLLNVTEEAGKRPKPQPQMLLDYELKEVATKREAKVNYVYQVDRRKIELIASLNLRSKGQFAAALRIPAGFELQAVQGADVADSWQEGDTLHVRFAKAVQEDSPLVVYLVRRYPSAPDKLELTPLTLRDYDTVRGEAVIAAHKGVKVSLQLSQEAKEIAPESAAKDFSILPPMERKRAFSFKNQSFSGSVAMEALPVRMNSTWVMAARVNEGWVSLSARMQTMLRQGSIDSLSFTLPASIPEARVTSPEIREVTSKIEGDLRRYNVVFHNSVYDTVEFTADVDIAAVEKTGIAVPALELDGMERTSGFVLVDNASESEMRLQPTGLEPARREEIPFLPELSQSATLYRAQPGWSLKIATTHLEKTASRAAFVAWAEITTAFQPDGTEWNRAVYRLQNRSLQFLPVRLPAGAELVGVQVAGQSVRADAGQVEKQAAVLIPLIKTQQGDLSYNVEVVYRMTQRKPMGMLTRRSLHDPSLIGITVEKTLWNIWLPEEYGLLQASGNMMPVLDEVNRTEKMQGTLDELKSLSSIIRSDKVSKKSQAIAAFNYEKLSKALESDAKEAIGSAKNSRQISSALNVKKGDAARQQLDVSQKAEGIQKELAKDARDVQKLQEIQKREPQTALPAEQIRTSQNEAKSWSSNKAYSTPAAAGEKAKAPQQDTLAPGNNLIINDNVVLQQSPSASVARIAEREINRRNNNYTGGSQLNGTVDVSGNISLNTARANTYTGATQLNSGALEINEGRDSEAPSSQRKKETALTPEQLRKIGEFTSGWNKKGSSNRTSSSDSVLGSSSPIMSAAPATQSPLNNYSDSDKTAVSSSQITAANRMGTETGGAISGNAIDSLLSPMSASAGAENTAGDRMDANAAAQPQLKPTGRVSLKVNFPTAGQVLHFKKVKANAALDLWVNRPSSFSRCKWALGFLILGGALAIVSGWVQRRRAGL